MPANAHATAQLPPVDDTDDTWGDPDFVPPTHVPAATGHGAVVHGSTNVTDLAQQGGSGRTIVPPPLDPAAPYGQASGVDKLGYTIGMEPSGGLVFLGDVISKRPRGDDSVRGLVGSDSHSAHLAAGVDALYNQHTPSDQEVAEALLRPGRSPLDELL